MTAAKPEARIVVTASTPVEEHRTWSGQRFAGRAGVEINVEYEPGHGAQAVADLRLQVEQVALRIWELEHPEDEGEDG